MNITIRHLMGGFIGGFVGIVLLHFAGFWAMCSGCVFGFVSGFWLREIYQDLNKPMMMANWFRNRFQKMRNRRDQFIAILSVWRKYGRSAGKKIAGYVGIFFLTILPEFFFGVLKSCLSAPGKFIRWFKAHPVNRSIITSLVAGIVWIATCLLVARWLYIHCSWYQMNSMSKQLENQGSIYYFVAVVAALAGITLTLGIPTEGDDTKVFYHRYEKWSQGAVKFAAIEFLKMVYSGLCAVILLIIGFFSMIIGFLFLFLGGFAVMVGQCVLKALFNISLFSTRKIHWIGVFATLATTIATAVLTRNNMNDSTVWFLALSNGMLCGIVSTSAYYLLKHMFRSTKLLIFTTCWEVEVLIETVPDNIVKNVIKPILRTFVRPLVA